MSYLNGISIPFTWRCYFLSDSILALYRRTPLQPFTREGPWTWKLAINSLRLFFNLDFTSCLLYWTVVFVFVVHFGRISKIRNLRMILAFLNLEISGLSYFWGYEHLRNNYESFVPCGMLRLESLESFFWRDPFKGYIWDQLHSTISVNLVSIASWGSIFPGTRVTSINKSEAKSKIP